jgi:hypothetical protein
MEVYTYMYMYIYIYQLTRFCRTRHQWIGVETQQLTTNDDDDDVYLDKLQTRGVKKSILITCET